MFIIRADSQNKICILITVYVKNLSIHLAALYLRYMYLKFCIHIKYLYIYIYICICTSLHMHLHIHMHIRYTKNTTISSVHVILEPLGAIRCPGAAMAGKIETAGES